MYTDTSVRYFNKNLTKDSNKQTDYAKTYFTHVLKTLHNIRPEIKIVAKRKGIAG